MAGKTDRGRLIALAWPVYGELLAGVVAGIVNMVWVARLGGDAVAAVAVATNVENLLLGVVLMAGSGTTVLVARAAGARHPAGLRAAVRGGVALGALLTPVVAVGGWTLREPLARLVLGGQDGPVLSLATGYFAISLPGIAVFYAQNILDGILKGTGDTRTPMRLALLANALILILDPLLILGLLGLPELGVPGAALATVIGRSIALAAGVAALRRNPLLRPARGIRPAEPLGAALRRTAATGVPMSADFLIRMAGSLALVAIVARLGVTEVAAYGIATKAMYVATMGFYALRQAASIHTAQTLGAREAGCPEASDTPAPRVPTPGVPVPASVPASGSVPVPVPASVPVPVSGPVPAPVPVPVPDEAALGGLAPGRSAPVRVAADAPALNTPAPDAPAPDAPARRQPAFGRLAADDERAVIGRQALLLGGAFGAGASVVLLVAAPWLMRAFGAEPAVVAAGVLFLRCLGPYLTLLACFIALGGVFEGSGGSPLMMRVTTIGVAVQLPLAYALSGLGLPGVCLAMGVSAGLQCLAVLRLFRRLAGQPERTGPVGAASSG